MRKMFAIAAIAVSTGAAGSALAHDDQSDRVRPAPSQRLSPDVMKSMINDLGYDVRRLEIDDGGFEAHIIDRKTSSEVKARFNGATGELVRARLAGSKR